MEVGFDVEPLFQRVAGAAAPHKIEWGEGERGNGEGVVFSQRMFCISVGARFFMLVLIIERRIALHPKGSKRRRAP